MQKIERSNAEISSMLADARAFARKFGYIGPNEPDDIAQMAMIKLLNRPDVKPRSRSWLYSVVRSTAYDCGRKHGRERQYLTAIDDLRNEQAVCERADESGNVHLSGTYIPARHEPDLDLIERLKSVLKDLTEPLRNVLVLHAQGYSYEQIAQLTNANLGTVRSRLHYARKRARALLGDLT